VAAPPPSAPQPAAPETPDPSFVANPQNGSQGWRTTAGGKDPTVALASIQIREGDEYALAFSFFIETMVYGQPGVDNLIMRLKSDASESHNFGLQLWDYAGDDGTSGGRGLWSSGEAMGGDRFLAPAPEQVWHDVVIHFKASSTGAGFYALYLDGELIDARSGVSLIVPGSDFAHIEVGLLRDGEPILGTSELRLDAVKLGETLESVLP
jgi:hypothetical protein